MNSLKNGCHFMLFKIAGRFWSGTGKVSSYQNLLQWSGDVMVPPSRCPLGFDGIFNSHWYVGRRLHFLRNGLWPTAFSWIHRRGRAAPHIQGKKANKVFLFWKRSKGILTTHRYWVPQWKTTGQAFPCQRSCKTTISLCILLSRWWNEHPG